MAMLWFRFRLELPARSSGAQQPVLRGDPIRGNCFARCLVGNQRQGPPVLPADDCCMLVEKVARSIDERCQVPPASGMVRPLATVGSESNAELMSVMRLSIHLEGFSPLCWKLRAVTRLPQR